MQIEIRACAEKNGEVVWVSESSAEFFGVYWGEPGKMEWVEDFECYTNALRVARELGEDNAAPVFYWASGGCFQKINLENDWQTQVRGNNQDEYQIYLACADNGKGGDITNNGKPLKSFDEWMNS